MNSGTLRMRFPATSANLGPGFDTAAVALSLFLEVEASPAGEFSISATGSDSEICSRLENNLIVDVYVDLLRRNGAVIQPLAIRMHNEIPLGMGCGSSAAGRLAAIVMANEFGALGWSADRILEEACALEGHPDNAAACWLGGFVAAANNAGCVRVARVTPPAEWRGIVVQPPEPLATSKARAVLPAAYALSDVIANLQAVSLLGLAFAQGRGDLLAVAMQDRIHQPYRAEICSYLSRLLPIAGQGEILGVALSGAGPAVLAVVRTEAGVASASESIRAALRGDCEPKLTVCSFQDGGAKDFLSGN